MLEIRDDAVVMTFALTDPNDTQAILEEVVDEDDLVPGDLTDAENDRVNEYVAAHFNDDGWEDEIWNEVNDLVREAIRRIRAK